MVVFLDILLLQLIVATWLLVIFYPSLMSEKVVLIGTLLSISYSNTLMCVIHLIASVFTNDYLDAKLKIQ